MLPPLVSRFLWIPNYGTLILGQCKKTHEYQSEQTNISKLPVKPVRGKPQQQEHFPSVWGFREWGEDPVSLSEGTLFSIQYLAY